MKNNIYWKKACKFIAGGNHLLSKNPNMLCPELWPAYFENSKGVYLEDLDKNKFLDFYLMGVGTNILGYSNAKINNSVIKNIKKGNMSSLNCKEEVDLAEYLIKINPWAQQVRFARTGGEANAVAIRIARASQKNHKQKVAISGYHGWHDWYLAANLKKKNLDDMLIPNIPTSGIPKNLKGTIVTFRSNDIGNLKKIISENPDIGIIKIEVFRFVAPSKSYLEELRQICDSKKIILIFDECTSGFREHFGGIFNKYNIFPDIAVFGKALGNGFAITAVVGKEKYMSAISKSFISSTFWTERVGPSAAIATLNEMNRLQSWEYISSYGKKIKTIWFDLSNKYDLKIVIGGLNAIPQFYIPSKNFLKYKTFITQEFLKENILAGNILYVSFYHDEKMLEIYKRKISKIFKKIKDFEEGENIKNYLDGKSIVQAFRKY